MARPLKENVFGDCMANVDAAWDSMPDPSMRCACDESATARTSSNPIGLRSENFSGFIPGTMSNFGDEMTRFVLPESGAGVFSVRIVPGYCESPQLLLWISDGKSVSDAATGCAKAPARRATGHRLDWSISVGGGMYEGSPADPEDGASVPQNARNGASVSGLRKRSKDVPTIVASWPAATTADSESEKPPENAKADPTLRPKSDSKTSTRDSPPPASDIAILTESEGERSWCCKYLPESKSEKKAPSHCQSSTDIIAVSSEFTPNGYIGVSRKSG